MPDLSRRDFLKLTTSALLTASGLLGLGGLLRFLAYQPDPPPPTEFDLGLATDYAPGSRTLLPDVPAVLVSNETGFTALSLVCTHLGCTIDVEADGFACPCHGSRFDRRGRNLRGPAKEALHALRVELAPDGHLVLHID
jgi:cytochrome b6-f complex iron-sulfur subunit